MSIFFVDTSALAKRYISESGSSWVRSWILPQSANTIAISALTTVEMISLLVRRQRENNLALSDFQRSRNNFLAHVRSQYIVVEINKQVIASARRMLTKYPRRTLDAIQLASADTRLLSAASAEGLAVDDPNLHP